MIKLPPEWDTFLPPEAIKIKTREPVPGMPMTKPEWNPVWLSGLETIIRSVVRDELSKKEETR